MVSNKCDMQGYTLEQWEDLHTGSGVAAEAYKNPKLTQEKLWGDKKNAPISVPDEHLKKYFDFKKGSFDDPEHTPLHRPILKRLVPNKSDPLKDPEALPLTTDRYHTNFDATIMADPNSKTLWLGIKGTDDGLFGQDMRQNLKQAWGAKSEDCKSAVNLLKNLEAATTTPESPYYGWGRAVAGHSKGAANALHAALEGGSDVKTVLINPANVNPASLPAPLQIGACSCLRLFCESRQISFKN